MRSATALPGTQHAATTAFAYDLAGRPLARTDALGRAWRFRYDRLGQLEETTDPLGRKRTMGYDEVGNLVSQVDGAGVELTFAYDVRGLLMRRTGPDVDDTFGYDGFGRQVLAKNALRTLSFEHDRLGRVVAVQDPEFLGTLRRSFDADGRMTQLLYPTSPDFGFPQGLATRFEYDPRGQLTGVRDPSGRWDHRYDALGRLVETRGPGGVAQRRAYTAQGFLSRVDTTLAGGGSEAIRYSQYDATGLPGRIDTSEGTTQLGYHKRGWLASVSYPDATSELFGYDRVGNRTSQTPRTGPPRFYGYDIADQLRLVIDADRFDTFTYDGAGRRITKTPGTDTAAQTRYEYDGLGRLTEVEQPGHQVQLAYDALGRRLQRIESDSGLARSAVYPSDWAEQRDGSVVRLVRGAGPDGVMAEVAPPHVPAGVQGPHLNTTTVLHDDGLGNLVHGEPLDHAQVLPGVPKPGGTRRYEAFGTLRSATGSIGRPAATTVERGFAGLVPEGITGLLYARARHYEPETGRFLQPEPMGLFQPNLYSYASNNPVVFSDPSGLAPQLNLSGPPDFLDFGSGDPFFGNSAAGSLGSSGFAAASNPLSHASLARGLAMVRPNDFGFADLGRLLAANDSAGTLSDVTRLQDRTVASLTEARERDPFGPNAGNFVKVELLGFDLATPFGGFEATLLGFFFGRDSTGNFQFGPFVEGGPAIGGALSLDTVGVEFVGNIDQLDRSLSINAVEGANILNGQVDLNPTPTNGGMPVFFNFVNGVGGGVSFGPLPVEAFLSFTQTRAFDVIGAGRRLGRRLFWE